MSAQHEQHALRVVEGQAPLSSGGELNQLENQRGRKPPPASGRFQPGQSGNPSGRPKADCNVKEVLERVLRRKVPVRGRGHTASALEAILDVVTTEAINRKSWAARLVLNDLIPRYFPDAHPSDGQNSPAAVPKQISAHLFEALAGAELNDADKKELSSLASKIDADLTSLSVEEYSRLRGIVDKARGTDKRPLLGLAA